MKAKTKMGRPPMPKGEARYQFVTTRVSPPEHKEIMRAVNKSDDSKTQWVRKKLVAAARRA
jgi:hypothetical protein